jgi:Protein of unknown function (DUF2789)
LDTSPRDLVTLFLQLGLPSDVPARQAFLQQVGPLPASVFLHDAPFWSKAQATFLQEAIMDDADWSGAVDRLDAMMRG